jgi:hypothetical protein
MRLKQEQIQRLAGKVYDDLSADALIVTRSERAVIVEAISAVISKNFAAEQTLEHDAERLLDETIAGMGRGAVDIDRRRMLKMIKEKLAKERKMVL